MLLFKKKFLDLIRTGQKTQTIRLWQHCRIRTGQRSYIPGIGYIRITAVDQVEIAQLTDQDALRDGFADAPALCHELQTLYTTEIAAGFKAYRIAFEVFSPEEQRQASAERKLKKKSDSLVQLLLTQRELRCDADQNKK